MTTKTNIEAVALSDEQKKQIAAIVHRDCTLIPGANFYTAAELAIQATVAQLNRALLASKPAVQVVDVKACRAGFEAQRKVGINVDWFTWQIAWHDAMFTQVDCAASPAPASPSGEDAAEQSAAPMAGRTHTTQAGESVMGIALRQCGKEAEWRHILACNPQFADMLPHEYFPVGTVLTLPPLPRASEQADEAVTRDAEILRTLIHRTRACDLKFDKAGKVRALHAIFKADSQPGYGMTEGVRRYLDAFMQDDARAKDSK